jgi:hypothetical protein
MCKWIRDTLCPSSFLSKTLGPQRNASGDATDRLMGSAKNAARLREAMATPDSEHRVFKSVEDLKNALGI